MKMLARVIVLSLGFTVLSGANCNPKQVVTDIVDCASPKIQAQLPDLASQAVAAALAQNWMSELWILAQAAGPALVCAEQQILAALTNPSSAPTKMMLAPNQDVLKTRIKAHLDSRYWVK